MDKVFEDFKIWINSKNDEWKNQDVIIDEMVESTHAHQIHVNLHSKFGFGHIGIFESNDIYWVEFEAVARESENFYKYFAFELLPDFQEAESEYLHFIARSE